MKENKTINWTSTLYWLTALCWFLIVVWIRLLLERSYFWNYEKSFQWGFSPDVIFMVHYQSEISDALHLLFFFMLLCFLIFFSWSIQQVKSDSYKLNPNLASIVRLLSQGIYFWTERRRRKEIENSLMDFANKNDSK